MRGHHVGVGDVDAMPHVTRGSRHQLDGDDNRQAARQHDTGMVGGSVECEHCATRQRGGTGLALVTRHGADLGLVALTAMGQGG